VFVIAKAAVFPTGCGLGRLARASYRSENGEGNQPVVQSDRQSGCAIPAGLQRPPFTADRRFGIRTR